MPSRKLHSTAGKIQIQSTLLPPNHINLYTKQSKTTVSPQHCAKSQRNTPEEPRNKAMLASHHHQTPPTPLETHTQQTQPHTPYVSPHCLKHHTIKTRKPNMTNYDRNIIKQTKMTWQQRARGRTRGLKPRRGWRPLRIRRRLMRWRRRGRWLGGEGGE